MNLDEARRVLADAEALVGLRPPDDHVGDHVQIASQPPPDPPPARVYLVYRWDQGTLTYVGDVIAQDDSRDALRDALNAAAELFRGGPYRAIPNDAWTDFAVDPGTVRLP